MSRLRIAVVFVLLSAAQISAETRYTFTELGVLPGFLQSRANAINNRGEIVGICIPPGSSNITAQAFYWTNGTITAVGYPGEASFATDINNAGHAVIGAKTDALFYDGVLHPVPRLSTGQEFGPYGINDS